MLSFIRSLFNNGDNNGKIIIKTTNNKEIKCHDFILKNTSDYFKEIVEYESFNNIIEMDCSSEIIIIILNYLYSEIIDDKNLSCEEIIHLYYTINQLKCKNFINILKNHYLGK